MSGGGADLWFEIGMIAMVYVSIDCFMEMPFEFFVHLFISQQIISDRKRNEIHIILLINFIYFINSLSNGSINFN